LCRGRDLVAGACINLPRRRAAPGADCRRTGLSRGSPGDPAGVDPAFVPFEFVDSDGAYKGITSDYIDLIGSRTGLVFEVAQGLSWAEAYDKALSGGVDVLPAVLKTAQREEYFLFSQPYYNVRRVIVTRDSNTDIRGMDDLKGRMVAVQKNSSHHSYLLSFPSINLSLYDTVDQALTAVASGTETVYVGNLATSNYLIRANGLTNLKFIAFGTDDQPALHFAVRKDWPELVGILNKAVASITEEEKIAINNKWIDLSAEPDYSRIIRLAAVSGVVVCVVLAVSFYWIVRLRKEVKKRESVQLALERAKLDAEEANNVKSSFLARMSHEIRTPLNAITGMAYLLRKTDVSPTQRMYIDRITQASTSMLSIINDILDFSKVESGKLVLERISFSLDQVIQDVVNIASYKIQEQKIGFRLVKDPNIPNWFFGDPKRMEQILLNLISNAAKFTDSGEVSLEIRPAAKGSDRCRVSFSVKDTGIGMSEDQARQLFQPFAQADVSISRRFGGTGLGLSIVKNLVDLMHGEIEVFSTVGKDLSLSSRWIWKLTGIRKMRIDGRSPPTTSDI
jgi:signal transduction histidine kinase